MSLKDWALRQLDDGAAVGWQWRNGWSGYWTMLDLLVKNLKTEKAGLFSSGLWSLCRHVLNWTFSASVLHDLESFSLVRANYVDVLLGPLWARLGSPLWFSLLQHTLGMKTGKVLTTSVHHQRDFRPQSTYVLLQESKYRSRYLKMGWRCPHWKFFLMFKIQTMGLITSAARRTSQHPGDSLMKTAHQQLVQAHWGGACS